MKRLKELLHKLVHMGFWFMTLKYLQDKNPDQDVYIELIAKFMNRYKKATIYHSAFEKDSRNKLHHHSLLSIDRIYWQPFLKEVNASGFHINVQMLSTKTDVDRVTNYLRKQSLNIDQCDQLCFANSIESGEYPFIN